MPSTSAIGPLLCVTLFTAAAVAQSVTQDFDATRPVTLRGTFSGSASTDKQNPQHVYLFLNVSDANGDVQRWAIEGKSMATLLKEGYRTWFPALKKGEITVVVYPPRRTGAKLVESLIGIPDSLPGVITLAQAGRLVHGTELTLGDGRKIAFGSTR